MGFLLRNLYLAQSDYCMTFTITFTKCTLKRPVPPSVVKVRFS